MLRIIPSRVHGAMDYLIGGLLILMPWLSGLPRTEPSGFLFIALGVAAIIYSFFTRYEWGVVPLLPMPGHLGLDLVHGALLAASPWLFDFADSVWVPHLALGLFEITVVVLSSPVAGAVRREPGSRVRPA